MRYCAIVLLLAGCASRPDMQANERGGMIDWFGTNESQVFKMANEHCAKFGRAAKITNINARAGGHVLFECV